MPVEEEEKVNTHNSKKKEKEVYLGNQQLGKDEELIFDNSAYEMLHRATVEWPSLSIDVLCNDRFEKKEYDSWFPEYTNKLNPALISKNDEMEDDKTPSPHLPINYPIDAYVVAGSQAIKKNDNKLYVMKWTGLFKTLEDDEENEDEEAKLYYESVPHKGGVNRVRSMHGSNIVATWSDEGQLSIFNLSEAIKRVEKKHKNKSNTLTNKKYPSLIQFFKHKAEGYALDWSPLKLGLLASGGCDNNIFLYEPTDKDFTGFKMHEKPLKGHTSSVEDVQFSPKQDHVLASCSVDKTVKLWDLREDKWKPQMSWKAHDSDVNVISWNAQCPYLIASGSDDGFFKVWDLRKIQKDLNAEPITSIKWHDNPITSIQFQPREECVLAVSSDDKLTVWDFSVEPENEQENNSEIPPQLMFLHLGQQNIRELRFHPYYDSVLISTAQDSYNIFKPNFDPEQQENDDESDGENEARLMNQQAKELQKQLDAMNLDG